MPYGVANLLLNIGVTTCLGTPRTKMPSVECLDVVALTVRTSGIHTVLPDALYDVPLIL